MRQIKGVEPRVACVHLPHVAMAVELRDQPALSVRPVAIEAPPPGPPTVLDVSYVAHRAGVVRGMALAEAQRVCPNLTVLPARPEAYRETLGSLLAALGRFTDAVEPADVERSWLSTAGLVSRGSREQTLAEELASSVEQAVGLEARVGVAHGKLTSRIVTAYLVREPVMVLPPGLEASFLGGLALRYLPLTAQNNERLRHLGLAKIHEYAGLPSAGILPRFGYDGLRAYELAHGHDDPRIRPWVEEPFLEAEHLFHEPIANLRSVQHHAGELTRQLAKPLAAQFQMAGTLVLTVVFEDGQSVRRQRILAEPAVSAKVLFTHVEALLESIAWGAPVERIRLAAQGLAPTVGRQLTLFRQAHEAHEGVETTLRQIQAKYGPDVVLQGHRLDPAAPLPERRAAVATWGQGGGAGGGGLGGGGNAPAGVGDSAGVGESAGAAESGRRMIQPGRRTAGR